MVRKSGKKQPAKARGAVAKNLPASAWHDAAIRYAVFLRKAHPRVVGKYRMVREVLCHVEGTVDKNGKPIPQTTVTRVLKANAPKIREWEKLYADAPADELLDFDMSIVPTLTDLDNLTALFAMNHAQRAAVSEARRSIEAAIAIFNSRWRAASALPSVPPGKWLLESLAANI